MSILRGLRRVRIDSNAERVPAVTMPPDPTRCPPAYRRSLAAKGRSWQRTPGSPERSRRRGFPMLNQSGTGPTPCINLVRGRLSGQLYRPPEVKGSTGAAFRRIARRRTTSRRSTRSRDGRSRRLESPSTRSPTRSTDAKFPATPTGDRRPGATTSSATAKIL